MRSVVLPALSKPSRIRGIGAPPLGEFDWFIKEEKIGREERRLLYNVLTKSNIDVMKSIAERNMIGGLSG